MRGVLVDRILRLVPKRSFGRSTNLLIWWFDADGWNSSVRIEPLGDGNHQTSPRGTEKFATGMTGSPFDDSKIVIT